MKELILIAGVNGTGKSSFRGVLEGQGVALGHIVDPDLISKINHNNEIAAGRQAVAEIDGYIENGESLTQETTLAGHRIKKTVKKAKADGYYITMYYIGLNTKYESIYRIANRVRKGGHDIKSEDVERRFNKRFESLDDIVPYCDKVVFYDNENGFVKVAEIIEGKFRYTNGYRPDWIVEYRNREEF